MSSHSELGQTGGVMSHVPSAKTDVLTILWPPPILIKPLVFVSVFCSQVATKGSLAFVLAKGDVLLQATKWRQTQGMMGVQTTMLTSSM